MAWKKILQYAGVSLLAVGLLLGLTNLALAVPARSPNFEITEPEFGAGAALETCSGEYCARASIGDIGGGTANNASTTAEFEPVESASHPLLEVIIEEQEANLGVLSTDTTASKTTLIKIRSYLSEGYTLQIVGQPPRYADHSLATASSPTTSRPGTEQFGINLVANTDPAVGANPTQVPSGEFSFGYVEADYLTSNQFMYDDGAVVARSQSESGRTDYTLSMIVNVADSTPAGHYQAEFAAVVIPVF